MSSINLSFKEWAFPSFQELSQPLIASPLNVLKSESSKDNLQMNFSDDGVSSDDYYSDSESSNQFKSYDSNESLKQVSKKSIEKRANHLSSWGKCGLFACTFENHLSILSNDSNGCLTPMFMFSPFDRLKKNKLTNSKSSIITSIAWANGCFKPSIARPILAVASVKGKIAIYDFDAKELIGSSQMSEPIISMHWSHFNFNRLYLGSNNGHFYICELSGKYLQIKEHHNFCIYNSSNGEYTLKSVDFISEDDIDGSSISIASKDGSIGIITKINDKKSKLQVFPPLPFNSCLGMSANNNSSNSINFYEFYPNDQDFVMIATTQSTFLFSTRKGVLIPFVPVLNCKFICLQNSSKDTIIIGDGLSISVWKLINKSLKRSSITNLPGKLNQTEILSYSKLNNKIMITTASNWLTELEFRRDKLFISKRIKLLTGIPIDYDFRNGSIAFLNDDNSISLTSWTPESIIKPKFGYMTDLASTDKLSEIQNQSSNNKQKEEEFFSESQNGLFKIVNDSNSEDDISIDSDDLGNSLSNDNNKTHIGSNVIRSSSMTFGIDSDSSRVFKQIFNQNSKDSLMIADIESPIPRSKSDLLNHNFDMNEIYQQFNEIESTSSKAKSLCGNSNSIILSFNIKSLLPIEHVSWAPSQKLIAWNKNNIYYIDLMNRTITEPLKKIFDPKSNTISQAFFSKSRKIMCIILNYQTVYLLSIESKLDLISSIDFKDKIKKDSQNITGSISPKEDQIVFASQNFLFFAKLDGNCVSNLKEISINLDFNASFISWKKCGIIIGTELGGVLLIPTKNLADIFSKSCIKRKEYTIIYDPKRSDKKNSGSIQYVSPCANNSYVIIDSNGNGTIVSGDIQQTIAGGIKVFKLCNKDTFLVRFQNINKLFAFDVISDFAPLPPPCFYFNQSTNISFNVKKKNNLLSLKDDTNNEYVNSIINQIFCTNEEKPSNVLRNSVNLLNQIISYHQPFNAVSLKFSLNLGDSKIARNLLLKTDPNDKEYMNKMMLAALFDTAFKNSTTDDSVKLAANSLIINNRINEAVDLLLITNNVLAAVEILYKFGKLKDAYQVLMLRNQNFIDHKNLEEAGKLIQNISNSLFNQKENRLFALKLLASYGYVSEMLNLLSMNLE